MEAEPLTNRKLSVQGGISKSRLQRNVYTLSLLREALQAGAMTSREVAQIQSDFMVVLQQLIPKYTRGESTSITTEAAESLMTSILYAADAYLFSLVEPERAVEELKTLGASLVYERGVIVVAQCLEETKQLYKEIRATRLDVPIEAYQLTIEEALPVFLRKYGVLFEAHNTMASIDYPLAVDDMKLQGVFYMKQYMERLKLETDFCAGYDLDDLLDLLVHYGQECRFDYRKELLNLFELVLNQAIFSVLSGGSATSIRISEGQFQQLDQRFRSCDKTQIRAAISDAMIKLRQELGLPPQTQEYLEWCLEDLVQRVANAAKTNSLRAIILSQREVEEKKSILLSYNVEDRMSDLQLRRVLHEIRMEESPENKVRIILARIRSFHDFLDLLDSDSLYGEEYNGLFHAFGEMELAILAKIVFSEELREGFVQIDARLVEHKEYPREWQQAFAHCLQGMEEEKVVAIRRLMDQIKDEG
ncbi:DUF6179 domain-containing protein [Gorillibacterium sp. CAU 1737]|uniref:DUF6179 domain-containing protein n=1 Tax=Gorillibacterium sp. CAU 1737 TaxID=3140362 RepID=UPI003260D097